MAATVSDVQVRPATAADIPAILAVTAAAYASYAGRFATPSSVFTEGPDAIQHYLHNGGVIVAQVGDEIVGAVRYEPRENYIYLGRLAVLPAWQGKGIGRRLVEAVEEWTLLLGLDEVRLGVRTELPGNRDLYRHLGYVDDGEEPMRRDPRYSYLKMKKRLRE